MTENEKVKENRIRRKLDRMGYKLSKSRTRDTDGVDFGLYAVIDHQTNGAVNPAIAQRWTHSWTLDQVEEWIQAA